MEPTIYADPEESLDPREWSSFRTLAHRMLDDLLDFQQTVRERPVWQSVPSLVEARFLEDAPRVGVGIERAYENFREQVLPFATGNIHPRFWGWVAGTGTPSGMLAEMLAGGLNAIPGNFNDGSARVETQVIRWMKSQFGFPEEASGVMTSGGSVANLVGLAVARDVATAGAARLNGLAGQKDALTLYTSTEVHSSVLKAAQLLGLGRNAVRLVPVDRHYRIRVSLLRGAIERDRARGLRPFAIVGNAGTVNTGAIDDLNALADLAADENLWLHVDGAFGALAVLSPDTRALVDGLHRSDSLAFDFHKWMYVPYEAGCVLVRNGEGHRASFTIPASYLDALPRGVGAQPDAANTRGPQLSRGFKALKVWMTIREHGLDKLGRMVSQNVAQAKYLTHRIETTATLELLAPTALNVVCFRYAPRELPNGVSNEINREILMRIQERGLAAPSSTVLDGKFAIRVANTNQRTVRSDFDVLVDAVVATGAEVLQEREARVPVPSFRAGLKARFT